MPKPDFVKDITDLGLQDKKSSVEGRRAVLLAASEAQQLHDLDTEESEIINEIESRKEPEERIDDV